MRTPRARAPRAPCFAAAAARVLLTDDHADMMLLLLSDYRAMYAQRKSASRHAAPHYDATQRNERA